jgi:hypothetical protein
MTFDESVEQLNNGGDTFMSVVLAGDKYQANCRSRYDESAYGCASGATPTLAIKALYEQRCGVKTEMDDLI